MNFTFSSLEKSFHIAIEEKFGPLEVTKKDSKGNQFIDCSPNRFSDALFVVKRSQCQLERCAAHAMDIDEFGVRWNVFFAEFKNYPRRHKRAPRQQVKYANHILVQSMYGSEVANGMQPEAFDPSIAVCFMNCIADASDSIPWNRNLLKEIFDRALEIYAAVEMQAKLDEEQQQKDARPTVKI